MSRYIDADALIKRIQDEHKFGSLMLSNMIADMQTADVVEVVHGEWIKIDKRGKNVQCSKCGNTLDLRGVNTGRGDANYCPNCGTRMDGMNKHEQIILLLIGWLESEHLGKKDEAIEYIKDAFDIDVTKWENYEEYIRKASEGE